MYKYFIILSSIFFLSKAVPDEKHFVIDICSYNNARWYEKNLGSVFSQTYTKYRVVYTDDVSTDGTADLVQEYINLKGQAHRCKVIRNPVRTRQLANHYRLIHSCKDDEIIVHLDGDDWFADDKVLERLNRAYGNKNIWMTYGTYEWWPEGKIDNLSSIPRDVIKNNTYRDRESFKKGAFHLRTFYAWLAKRVKLEGLIFPDGPHAGKFLPAAADWALLYPMFEMAGGRFRYVKDVLYIYNFANPLGHIRTGLELQRASGRVLRSNPPYEKLEGPIKRKNIKTPVPIICFSSGTVEQPRHVIRSRNGKPTLTVTSVSPTEKIKPYLESALAQNSYILFSFGGRQDFTIEEVFSCIRNMKMTKAHSFYADVSADSLGFLYEWLRGTISFFQYNNVVHPLDEACEYAVFRRSALQPIVELLDDEITAHEFLTLWVGRETPGNKLGLFSVTPPCSQHGEQEILVAKRYPENA